MPKAGPQHVSLQRFAGTFRAEVRLWMDPSQPPNVSHGTMINRAVLNGLFLEQVYKDDADMFEGRGYWGYNEVDRRYEGFWIDPMATLFQLEHGKHDLDTDVYDMSGTMTNPGDGQTMQKRSVIRYLGPEAHVMEMYFRRGDGPEMKCMEIRYTRT